MAESGSDPNDSSIIAYEAPDLERGASTSPTEGQLDREMPGGSEAQPLHDPYAALRIRPFLVYVCGWVLAVLGQSMTATAIGWEIYKRTGSKLSLGLVAGIQVIPLVVLALPAGVLADRFDRRRIIVFTSVLAAACSVGLFDFSYRYSVLWMYGFIFLSATSLTLGRPARSSLLPHIVPMNILSNAITWNSSFFQIAAMSGPALAGLLIRWTVRGVYLIDAVCAIAFAVLVMLLPPLRPTFKRSVPEPVLDSLQAGVAFVWRTKIILATLSLDLFAVLLGGAVYLLPAFATDILKVGPTGFGWLRAADTVGAFVMTLIVAHLPPFKKAGRAMLIAVMGFGMATIVFALSRNFWLSLSMLVLVGAFDSISVIVRHTLVQVMTPDAMRGRVSAVNNIFIGASNELGGFESGVTAFWWGPVASVVIGGIGTILTVLTIGLLFPQIRRFGSLKDAKTEDIPEPRGFEVIPVGEGKKMEDRA